MEESPAQLVVFAPSTATCLEYDVAEARLVFLQDGARHEIEIRAQAHRLVRHMAERNAEAHTPVLCTHEELMRAVWGDEPLHTHEELAKLVWELRRKLEPFGAEQLLENVRGLGYRMRTCEASEEPSRPRRARRWLVGAAVAALLVTGSGAAAGILLTRGSSPGPQPTSSTPELRTFVDRIENILGQSAAGRREIGAALGATFACRIPPRIAGRRIASVGDNRQSVLDQLGGLRTPTPRSDTAVTLLQRALQWSVEADRHYRDALEGMSPGCPIRSNLGFVLAHASDRKADAAKQRFLSVFNPLAERFGRRTWAAAEI